MAILGVSARLTATVTVRFGAFIRFEGVETIPTADSQPTHRPDADAGGPRLTVVVPVFDEAANIVPLLAEIDAALAPLAPFEAVVVDDGSTDGTDAILARETDRYPWLLALRHGQRAGKAAALRTGVKAARAATVVTLDGDRQNDPADVPRLLDEFETARRAKPDLALLAGQRRRRRDTMLRRLSSRVANGVRARLLGDATRDSACGFKIVRRDVFLDLPDFDGLHRFLPALVKAHGHRVMTAAVSDRPRAAGTAKYGLWNRLWVGILDLLAVYWLIRRRHLPGTVTSLSAPPESAEKETR